MYDRTGFLREMNDVARRFAHSKTKLGRPYQTTLFTNDYGVPMEWPEGLDKKGVYTQFFTVDIGWVYDHANVLPPNDQLSESQDWVLKHWIPHRWHIRNYFLQLANRIGARNLVAMYPDRGEKIDTPPAGYVEKTDKDMDVSG